MATSIGTLAITFTANTSGVDRGVDHVQKRLSGLSSGLASGLGFGAFAGGIAGVTAMLTSQLTRLASQGIRSVVSELTEAAARVDRLAKSSERLKVPVDELIRMSHAATLAGINSDLLQRGIGRMLVTVGTGGKTATQRFKEVAREISGIADAGQRAARSVEVFGRGIGLEILPALSSLADNMERADRLMKRFDLDISRADAAGVEAMRDAWSDMRFVMEGTFNKLLTQLAPAVTIFLQDMLDMGERIGAEFKALGVTWETVGDVATGVMALMSVEMQKLIAGVKLYRAQWLLTSGDIMGAWALAQEASAEMSDAVSGKAFADIIARQEKLIAELKAKGSRFDGLGGELGTAADKNPAMLKGSMEAVRAIQQHGANPMAAVADNTRGILDEIKPMRDDIRDMARRDGTGFWPTDF